MRGLIVEGIVKNRGKRMVGEPGKEREVVRYHILADDNSFDIEDWQPPEYFRVGEHVAVRVSVRVYSSAKGVGYSLNVQRGMAGEF